MKRKQRYIPEPTKPQLSEEASNIIGAFRLLIIVVIIWFIISLSGCYTMRTGYYTISEIRGLNTVVFKELPNDAYHVPRADTLRIGQRIHLKRVYREKDADVW